MQNICKKMTTAIQKPRNFSANFFLFLSIIFSRMQWRKSGAIDGQVLYTEKNKIYQSMTRNYTLTSVDGTNYFDMMKGGFMQNYTELVLLFIVLMERKIQRKFQVSSCLATLMQWCSYILNNKKFTKVKTIFTAFDRTETILGMMFIFTFYWFQWGQVFHLSMLDIYLCPNQKTAGEVWISKLQRKTRFLFRCLNDITSLRRTQIHLIAKKTQIHYLYALPKWGNFRKYVPFLVGDFVRMVVRVWLS